ncbi:MAG TPA: glutamate 5-kinase, partial [Solirubrobacterales bacterium]|nr:glutamate 5-kinase [Solirubrobacterales bacterium]
GMRLMGLPVRPRAMDELQAASAVGQGDLFRAYESRLSGHGTRAAQVLLTAADIAARTNYLNARQTLRRLIEWGVVPVVNENDTTATDEITFGDNDFLAAQLAILLDARLLVLLSDVDGVHRSDPRTDPDAELIDVVEDFGVLAGMEIGDRTSAFGSGGMRSKVAAAEMASEAGIPATICDGTKQGTLLAAAGDGGVGTRFAAQAGKAPSFKLWLKYAKPVRGRLTVDDGAARVLRESGSSLLPVGIVEVEGSFEVGDAVEVTANGSVVGKGIVDYSAQELGQVTGLKSAQVRELLPHAADEVIHRDRFVLL